MNKSTIMEKHMSKETLDKILFGFNDTKQDYPNTQTIQELFEAQAKRTPDAEALLFRDKRITFGELNRQSNRLAWTLRKNGIGRESLVAIVVERSVEMVIGIFAILKAGGAYLPISPGHPDEYIKKILENSNAGWLLSCTGMAGRIKSVFDCKIIDTGDPANYAEKDRNPDNINSPADLAYVIYTSGSTGQPKGVMIEHHSVINRLKWMQNMYPLSRHDRILQKTPCTFDVSVWELFWWSLEGAGLALLEPNGEKDPSAIVQAIEDYRITTMHFVPSMLQIFLNYVEKNGCVQRLGSLKRVFASGEKLSVNHVAHFNKLLFHENGTSLVNLYGPTEATVDVSYYDCLPMGDNPVVPIGKPVANTRLLIIKDDKSLAGIGEKGELCISGVQLARGYLNREDLTRERFVMNPFLPGERMYRTGDMASWLPDGNIEYLGRIDNQVKVRGFRIELEEIECVMDQYPGIKNCAVIPKGEGENKRLVAYILYDDECLNEGEMSDINNTHVSNWKVAWEQVYEKYENAGNEDEALNIKGWISSYTDKPIPGEEMLDWVNGTVERIRSLKPKRVLEIGCGTGMLLFRIAPHCEHYCGLDLSEEAIHFCTGLAQRKNIKNVKLLAKSTDELGTMEPDGYDMVVINSVTQFFPNAHYLKEVVAHAARLVDRKGIIYIGDNRSLPLLKAYNASVLLYKSSESSTRESLEKRVASQISQEEELVIDPDFFFALTSRIPCITNVEIYPKTCLYLNEMSLFRFDVVLELNSTKERIIDPDWLDWHQDIDNPANITSHVNTARPDFFGVKNIPDARLFEEVKTLEWLSGGFHYETVGEWKEALNGMGRAGYASREEIRLLAGSLGYSVKFFISTNGGLPAFNALFARKPLTFDSVKIKPNDILNRPLEHYTNNPVKTAVVTKFIPGLRMWLGTKIPDHMVPEVFVLLEKFPLTPNGKIDRKALPEPGTTRPDLDTPYCAPRDELEKRMADLWSEILGLDEVGIFDRFLDLGGNSLTAITLAMRIRSEFNFDFSLDMFYRYATIADFSALLDQGSVENEPAGENLPVLIPNTADLYECFPLNDMQQAYLLGRESIFEVGNISTHVYLEFSCPNLDHERFEKALNSLILRHGMLRCVILPDGTQKILKDVGPYRPEIFDLSGKDNFEIERHLVGLKNGMCNRMLKPDRYPLFDVKLSIVNNNVTRVHIHYDFLIIDGLSQTILMEDFKKFYRNQSNDLNPFTVSFRDYVFAFLKFKETNKYRQSMDYWKSRLEAFPSAPRLPVRVHPSSLENPVIKRIGFKIGASMWETIRDKAAKISVTPTTLLITAFAEVLALWCEDRHFIVNLPLFNRIPFHPEVNDMVGQFGSILLLEVNKKTGLSFARMATEIQKQLWQDLQYNYVSGIDILRELSRHKENALFTIVFTSVLNTNFLDPEFEVVSWITQSSQVWLDAIVHEYRGEAYINWDYLDDLFPENMMDNMLAAYEKLIERLAGEELPWDNPLKGLYTGTDFSRRIEANDTDGPCPEKCLHELFVESAVKYPEKKAIITADREMTYRELYNHASAVSTLLESGGVECNELVAIVMEKGWEQIAGALGILFSGAAYLPIDGNLPEERIRYLLQDGKVRFVFTQSRVFKELTWPEDIQVFMVDDIQVSDVALRPRECRQAFDDLAYVIYTSGSSGRPKGVMISHRGAVNTIHDINNRFSVGSGDRVLALSSLSFDLSVYDIFGLLAVGGGIVLPHHAEGKNPKAWHDLVVKNEVTVWNTVPALMEMYVTYLSGAGQNLPAFFRLALMSGDWIPIDLPDKIRVMNPSCRIISLGGATEASIWSIFYIVEKVKTDWKSIPYGKPLTNQRFSILNDDLEPCPDWVPGEIYISGIGLALGYWNDREKTNNSFFSHPKTGERLYRTGDMGRYLPDGNIEILGRKDFQVKIAGYRIELGEIENTMQSLGTIRQCAVVVKEYPSGQKKLVIFYIPEEGAVIKEENLAKYLQGKLPNYMVPDSYVRIDRLPLNANGKVDRKKLLQMDGIQTEQGGEPVAPRDPVEKNICDLCCEILDKKIMGVFDNFFTSGGNSILAIRLIAKLRDLFQVEIPIARFFKTPNIAGWSEFIVGRWIESGDTEEMETALEEMEAGRS
ncbi:MAG: amino acid adenylation domain-containing protein [Spirochaetales bacterium]|nr:amino acid adenylation domain-containing protein [Spirochaetales bacterium]